MFMGTMVNQVDGRGWEEQWLGQCDNADRIVCFLSKKYFESKACHDEFVHAMKVQKLCVVALENVIDLKQCEVTKSSATPVTYLKEGGQCVMPEYVNVSGAPVKKGECVMLRYADVSGAPVPVACLKEGGECVMPRYDNVAELLLKDKARKDEHGSDDLSLRPHEEKAHFALRDKVLQSSESPKDVKLSKKQLEKSGNSAVSVKKECSLPPIVPASRTSSASASSNLKPTKPTTKNSYNSNG